MSGLRQRIEQQKQLRKRRQQEGRQPLTRVEQVKLRATRGEQQRFTEEHPLALLKIETSIIDLHRELGLDDSIVASAIRCTLHDQPPKPGASQALVERLEESRLDCEYDLETWRTGLRVIYLSVTTVSKCQPNERSYLEYAFDFVNKTAERRAFRPQLR